MICHRLTLKILKRKCPVWVDQYKLSVIEERLNKCRDALKADLRSALNSVIDAVIPDLSRAVLADPPPRFRGLFPATPESAADYVKEELAKSFPTAENLVSNMKIHRFYKDVTYETLKDRDFGERVMEQIPKAILDGSLLQEELAVKAGKATS